MPFGQGPRRCPGQKVARGMLKHLVRFILVEFPPSKEEGKATTWENFRPMDGHKWSGRNNDNEAVDTVSLVRRLATILVESFAIGMKRRTTGA